MDEVKYEYKYWYTNLGDGGFNKAFDGPLGKMLSDGFKPLREIVVTDGWVLFVLSRPKTGV